MRWVAIEYLGHGLALIRRERRHIDERLDSFLVGRSDHSACISVPR
jgi:hypothetical protein